MIASNSNGSGAEADSGYTCALTIGESASLSAILSGLSIEADGVKSVAAEGNNLTVNQTAGEQPTDWTVVLNSAEGDVLRLTMSDDSTVGIAVKPLVTVTANDAGKTYGDSDPGTFTAAVTGLAGEDTVAYSVSRETGENAGTYAITPSGEEIQGNYVVEYKTGTFTVEQKPLTITADSDTKAFDGAPLTKATFTYSGLVAGDTIVSMTMSESSAQTHMGTCENVPEAAVIRNASNEDVTANYAITFVNGTLTVTWPDNMVEKKLTDFNGNLATYQIIVNPAGYVLTADGQTYILKDTFSENQSINYGSVNVSNDTVTYDFSGQTGTYIIPDGTRVNITYTTRVAGQVGKPASFSNTAVVGSMGDSGFVPGPAATVNETRTISPTGTDISGTGGVYSIELFVYAEGHMERGLEGAEFRLLDSNMRPMHYLAGENAGREIAFTTGNKGTVTVALDQERDGLSIQKNTVYFLEMTAAPYDVLDGVYYQKDDTFYSFLITDEPSYEYGDIFSYFNGDVLKVRCYPEAEGINVTKRFGGNYTLTDEQKNAIRFVLQKEAQYTASGWVDVESHTYADFAYGSINFDTGRKGGTELEDFATYRIIEEHALPDELAGTIDENVSVTVSYQREGKRVTEATNEFFVDPDENTATSGGAVYVNSGTFTLGSTGSITGCSATSGGAIYVNDGTVEINGTVSASTATNGGAVYLTKGSLTVAGALTENAAASGGAVYLAGGTCTVEAGGSLSGNSAAENGGAVYQANGTLTNNGEIRGNSAANGGGIYRVGGTLTVGGILSGNEADEEGGAIHSTNGTLNVNAAVIDNHAATGGAVYVSGATLNINGGSFSQNTATANGGAVYALNSTTRIGSADAEVTVENNTSEGNGGAVYMEGGSVTVENVNSTLTGNSAINGGGIYATSGAITVNNGRLESNEATANGGAIYAESASVTVRHASGCMSSRTARPPLRIPPSWSSFIPPRPT